MTVTQNDPPSAQRFDRRSLRILARTLARDLTADGLDAHALLALASELLSEATARLRAERTIDIRASSPAGSPDALGRS
jgi:hypothetical protein